MSIGSVVLLPGLNSTMGIGGWTRSHFGSDFHVRAGRVGRVGVGGVGGVGASSLPLFDGRRRGRGAQEVFSVLA